MLSHHERRFLSAQRVGHLATADSRAIPHVVPVCFTISQGTLYITVDEKPKRVAGLALKRVRNIERNPMVAIVVDRYDEDWTRLGWVMLRGRAAPSTLCRHARQLRPAQRPNAWPIPGIKPVLTLHHPLLRKDRSAPMIRFPLVRRPTSVLIE